ncbi:MAG: CRISPR-associated protein Csx16 [Cohaesibacter sp.]|nr:CRISPR-associated protein Csx16 [Cohaesibacter sp.]MCV6602705.1 CRISPR-associated protein Csx16 [Cohaesibacter sp.]
MTTYFVTRHKGAIEWAERRGIEAVHVTHLETDTINPGDIILGTLPVFLAAEICKRGARYFHLSIDIPVNMRGTELAADDLDRLDAQLQEYDVRRV